MEDKDEKSHNHYVATEHVQPLTPPATLTPSSPIADKDFTDIPLSEDQPTQQSLPDKLKPPPTQETFSTYDTPSSNDYQKLGLWQKITFSYVAGLVQKAQKYAYKHYHLIYLNNISSAVIFIFFIYFFFLNHFHLLSHKASYEHSHITSLLITLIY